MYLQTVIGFLTSLALALTLAPMLGVCVHHGDPLEGLVPPCIPPTFTP